MLEGTECSEVGVSGTVSELRAAALDKSSNGRGKAMEKPGLRPFLSYCCFTLVEFIFRLEKRLELF